MISQSPSARPFIPVRPSPIRWRLFGVFVGWLGSVLTLLGQPAPSSPHVLVLNSYHAGYSWSDGELQGLLRVLLRENPAFIPSVEFLDTKREASPAQLDRLLTFIREKYRGTHFDLIVTLDDAAFQFALAHRAELGPEVPIVFGGVNDYRPEKLAGVPRVTGVAEAFDFAGNLELILQLRPGTHTVHLICDTAAASRDTMTAFQRIAPQFEGRIHFQPVINWTAEELLERVAALPSEDAGLVIGNARDAAGRVISEDSKFIHAIAARSTAPILMIAQPALPLAYGYGWEQALWFGIGGRMLSSDRHGEAVGEIACRILRGEDPAKIPVLTTSPTRLAFDYQQLLRHHIDLRRLPPDAELFNRPQTFFELYRGRILVTLGVILLLATAVVVLSVNNVRRQRAERALRRSNERFELIARATHDGVWELDLGSGTITGNEAFTHLLELPPGAAPTLAALTRKIHLDDRAAVTALLSAPPPKIETVSRELRLVTDANTIRFALLRVYFRRDATGKVVQVLGSMLDLTPLRQAENQLHLLLTAVDQANDLIALLNSDGSVSYANPTLTRALRRPFTESSNHCNELWQDGRGTPLPFSAIATSATEKDRWQERVSVSRSDGTSGLLQVIVTPIRRGPGQTPCFLLIGQDVTQETRLAEQIRLAQKMEAIGTLASGIAHDFNNILTAIVGNTELALCELSTTDPAAELLHDVRKSTERATRLIRQILTFSRHTELRREVLCVTAILDETLKFLRATVPASVTLRHTVVASPRIMADPTQIYQVILNLCTNAAHAIGTRPGVIELIEESVDVSPEMIAVHSDLTPGPHLRVSVRDDGDGMPPEVARRIFEPFFTTKLPGQGTGLGLAVAHGIIKNHRAAITVYSTPGKGTVFHLYFPVVASTSVVTPKNEKPATSPRGRGQRLVIVDDEEAITQIATRALQGLGYVATPFNRPEDALAHLSSEGCDLLITDYSMPGLSGVELVERVRAFAPMLPVILISGYLPETAHAKATQLAIHRIVEKPLTTFTLSDAVNDVFSTSARP